MKIVQEAKALQQEMIAYRRELHARAETGFELPKTTAFVENALKEMGYHPQRCGKAGIVATIGQSRGKAFLLRADMDALPICEKTALPFASNNGNMHACGHDMHTAMLLGCAKILKMHEKQIQGKIKLMFQPAEELLEGAKDMLENGVLRQPAVNGAVMLHVMTGVPFPCGTLLVSSPGVGAPAADFFTIRVQGKGCHGSTPEKGVDALSVAARILLGLEEISARELALDEDAVLTIGKLQGGEAANAIADTAFLQGTLRAYEEEVREKIKKRITEIARSLGTAFRAKTEVRWDSGCPTFLNDEKLSSFAEKRLKESLNKSTVYATNALNGGKGGRGGGSEDFAYVSHKVPTVMLSLAAGEPKKGYAYPLHHPKADFDENALSVGAAAYALLALKRKE